jgi:hypothetical protein
VKRPGRGCHGVSRLHRGGRGFDPCLAHQGNHDFLNDGSRVFPLVCYALAVLSDRVIGDSRGLRCAGGPEVPAARARPGVST